MRQRLLNKARERGEDFQLILTWYAIERLLYRISQSDHAESFVLKGAMLFTLWDGPTHRPTRDLDLLAFGDPLVARMEDLFRELCQSSFDDGLEFDIDSINGEEIRETNEYDGVRISVGVQLGIANTRMKDFYDLWILSRRFEFDGPRLAEAIAATFERRRTPIPEKLPLALTSEFSQDPAKQIQWRAFLNRGSVTEQAELQEVVTTIASFLVAPAQAARSNQTFSSRWPAAGPWNNR